MKKKRVFSTRSRAIISSVLIGLIFFMLLSPIITSIISILISPNSPRNVTVIEKSGEFEMRWDNESIDIDVVGFRLEVDGQTYNLDVNVDNFIVSNLENDREYIARFFTVDNTSRTSSPLEINITPSFLRTNSIFLNEFDPNEINQNTLFIITVLIFIMTFIFNLWVIFFRIRGRGLFTIGLYPSVAITPFVLLLVSLFFSINNISNKTLFILLGSIGLSILSYIIFLTSNILHSSLKQQIPLEQAARAAQFIISLISSYIIFIYSLSSNYGLPIKILIITPFIFYFTYSGIWILKNISSDQILTRTVAIVVVMILSLLVVIIWPLNIIYSILTASIIYYILLNVALDYRTKLNINYWVEYIILIILTSILLASTAVWGINGTII